MSYDHECRIYSYDLNDFDKPLYFFKCRFLVNVILYLHFHSTDTQKQVRNQQIALIPEHEISYNVSTTAYSHLPRLSTLEDVHSIIIQLVGC